MRTLIFQRYMEYYSGAENVVNKLSACLKKKGVDNVVMALNVSDEVRKICADVAFIVPEKKYPAVFRSVGFWTSLGIFREIYELRKMINRYSNVYDIINVHNFPATWALYGIKKPVVWLCNEIPDFYSNPNPSLPVRVIRHFGIKIDRFLIKNTVTITVVADEINARKVRQRYNIEPVSIPYGIDTDIFGGFEIDEKENLKKYNIAQDEFVLSQVGVISPQKNQIESIKGLETLLECGVKAKLIIAGEDNTPYKKVINKYIAGKKLSDKIIFTGAIKKTEVARIYKISKICLFPVKEQGGWLSPFEALSCGTPVVVSSTMGASDLLGRHDFCVISNDISSGVKKVYDNYNIYRDKAKNAQKWVNENLTWGNYTERMLRVFEDAIKSVRIS